MGFLLTQSKDYFYPHVIGQSQSHGFTNYREDKKHRRLHGTGLPGSHALPLLPQPLAPPQPPSPLRARGVSTWPTSCSSAALPTWTCPSGWRAGWAWRWARWSPRRSATGRPAWRWVKAWEGKMLCHPEWRGDLNDSLAELLVVVVVQGDRIDPVFSVCPPR